MHANACRVGSIVLTFEKGEEIRNGETEILSYVLTRLSIPQSD